MFKIVMASAVVGAAVFALQTLLFRKTERRIFRLIPVLVIGLCYVAAIFLFVLDLNRSGGYLFNTLIAMIIFWISTAALIADAAAWLVEKV